VPRESESVHFREFRTSEKAMRIKLFTHTDVVATASSERGAHSDVDGSINFQCGSEKLIALCRCSLIESSQHEDATRAHQYRQK
jgi:hypothetical protein